MLASMRKGASSFLSKALMLFLVMTFAVWGIGDMLRQNSGAVVTVGDVKVSPAEFDMRLRNMQRSLGDVPAELTQSEQFKSQVLQGIVQQALLLQEARTQGLMLDDKAIARLIGRTPEFQSATGRFDGAAFKRFLAANNTNEASFIETLKRDVIAATLLQSMSLPKTLGFASLAKALAEAQGQTRSAELFVVRGMPASEVKVPDDATLESYYKEVQESYLTPEYRTIDYVSITQAQLDARLQDAIGATDIQDRYALEKEHLGTPEKRTVSQWLFDTQEKAAAASDALKSGQAANEVKKAFPPKNGQITVMRDIRPDALPKEAADAAFSIEKGHVSAPVETAFGWHVFVVDGITPAKIPSLKESEAKIREMLMAERREEELAALSGELEDAVAAGDDISKAASALKMGATAGSFEDVDAEGRNAAGRALPSVRVAPTVLAKGYQLEEGENSGFELTNTKDFVAVFVREVSSPAPKPFADVKQALLKQYIEEHQRIGSAKRAQNIALKLGKAEDANEVARTENLQRRSVKGISLAQAMAAREESNGMSPIVMRSLFDTKLGGFTAPSRLKNGDWVIGKVTGISQSVAPVEDGRTLSEEQRAALSDAIYNDYLQYLIGKYPVKVNEALLRPSGENP